MPIITVDNTASLQQALKAAQAGDVIALQAGVYSGTYVANANFGLGVTITSADASNPAILTDLKVVNSQGLTFKSLEFTTQFAKADNPFMVSGSQNIHFNGLDVHGSLDGNAANDVAAFLVRSSSDVSMTNSEFHELLFGFGMLDNNKVVVSGNSFHDMRSDGVRGAGTSNVEITNNSFTDFRPANGDHPDAIQFWTANTKESAHDFLISGNVITRGDGGSIQGIFLGDESGGKLPFINAIITDNLLVGTGYNGIALAGKGGEISGNTLVAYDNIVTRVRVQNADGVLVQDNSASDYVYINATNITKIGNLVEGFVFDLGASALQKWSLDRAANPFELAPARPAAEPAAPAGPVDWQGYEYGHWSDALNLAGYRFTPDAFIL